MNSWYSTLKKPSWAPVETVFGQVWSVLYVIIFAVNIFVLSQVVTGKLSWKVGLPFWINLAANFAFTPLQFGLRNNFLALFDIIIILLTIVWAMAAIWPTHKGVALAYSPYLLWVSIATVLQASITWLNK